MPWWIVDGVLFRSSVIPTGNRILTRINGWGQVVIPNGVTKIDDAAFQGCMGMKSLIIQSADVRYIGKEAFMGCAELIHAWIDGGVEYIGERAFHACLNLKVVELSAGVKSIGEGAFSECRQLTRIALSQNNPHFRMENNCLISKDGTLLWAAPNVDDVVVPEGVTSITKEVFSGRRSLRSVTLPNGLKSIGENAFFWCDRLQKIDLPDSLTHIGQGAFSYCRKLKSVALPAGITHIENSTFEGCTDLAEIHMPSGLTHIGAKAFRWCDALEKITLPKNLTHIGWEAFCHCRNLTEVVFGDSVTRIEEDAFCACDILLKLILPDSVTEIGSGALTGRRHLGVPKAVWSQLDKETLREAHVLVCPVSLKEAPANTRLKLCIGFILNEEQYSEELRSEYHAYIKKNAVKLVETAFDYPEILHMMCREKLISAKDIDRFTEEAVKRENTELIAAILDYQASALTVKEVVRMREHREKLRERQDEMIIERMEARADQTGIEGLNFAVTGKLNQFAKREELKAFITERGGKLMSAMSAKTDYLITNDTDTESAKNKRAAELGIVTMTEDEFLQLAEGKKTAAEVRGVTML